MVPPMLNPETPTSSTPCSRSATTSARPSVNRGATHHEQVGDGGDRPPSAVEGPAPPIERVLEDEGGDVVLGEPAPEPHPRLVAMVVVGGEKDDDTTWSHRGGDELHHRPATLRRQVGVRAGEPPGPRHQSAHLPPPRRPCQLDLRRRAGVSHTLAHPVEKIGVAPAAREEPGVASPAPHLGGAYPIEPMSLQTRPPLPADTSSRIRSVSAPRLSTASDLANTGGRR